MASPLPRTGMYSAHEPYNLFPAEDALVFDFDDDELAPFEDDLDQIEMSLHSFSNTLED